MTKRWVVFAASGTDVVIVDVSLPGSGPLTVNLDETWKLQGNDPAGYHVMYQRVSAYVRDNQIDKVVIKGSAVVPRQPAKLSLLTSAELRGVVAAAAASVLDQKVVFRTKANASRTGGERTVDEYVQDDSWWTSRLTGAIRKGSREAAYLLMVEAGR